jgi:predicted Zn-dependent protease
MSVKVVVNGNIGSSHTTDIQDIDGVVERALEAAEFGSPAHFDFPGPKKGPDVKVYDDAAQAVKKGEMVRIGEEMMGLVKDYNRDILVSARVWEQRSLPTLPASPIPHKARASASGLRAN